MARLVFCLVVIAVLFFSVSALQFDVGANQERCFVEEYPQDQLVVGEYHVLPGQFMDVEITITDPKATLVFKKEQSEHGKFAFTTTLQGDYKLCFHNRLAPGMAYSVGLKRRISLDIKTGVDAKDYSELAKAEQLKPLELELRKMEDTVNTVLTEMLYMRGREEVMRNTNESTNSRVLWFSLIVLVVFVVLSVTQIYYMKRFFRSKKLI